jgi:hypothetical protein
VARSWGIFDLAYTAHGTSAWMAIAMKLFLWLLILCSQAPLASEIREATVTLSDGARIHLLEAGQRSAAPAIVFIPGWTLPAFLWKEQMHG